MTRLSETDPMAQALMYVEDATTSTSSNRRAEAFCHNCRQFQGDAEATWGPCEIFPEHLVHRQGWCSVWLAREE